MTMNNKIKREGRTKFPFWFYLILILIPILFFTLLELSLRVFNYGRNHDQWIQITETKQMLNPDIAGRYFFNIQDLPQSNNDTFDIIKRENAFRVFVMGGSSAAGFPFSPNGTFSRYIRDRLELLNPEKHIEVINIAITATNSYTIRDLLPEVLEQKPDLILIYAGHNEYYGAFGVGSTENVGNSRKFVNFLIWLNKFKSVELFRNLLNLAESLFNSDEDMNAPHGGTLMARIVKQQLIPFKSESFNVGIAQFEGNLEEILRMTKEDNVPVIIGTLVSNLKDQKPFVSVKSDEFESADSIYERAQCQLKLGDTHTADSLFRYAKDLDALRFRAPEKINSIIKELAIKYDCRFINIDSAFNALSPEGIVGNNLIADHLHPSLTGYLLMGKIYFEGMEKYGFLTDGTQLQIPENKQDSIVISNFAFSSLDSAISGIRLKGLLNDWPFIEKSDFSFIKELELKDKIDSIAYEVAVENFNWEKAHREAATYYLFKKNYKSFAKEMLVIISQFPFKLTDYDFAASKLIEVKEFNLAYGFLSKRYKEFPDAFSTKWLGNINLNKGNFEVAIKYFQKSIRYNSSDAQVYYNLAGAFIQKEDYVSALEAIKNCININADFPNARNLRSQLTKKISQ